MVSELNKNQKSVGKRKKKKRKDDIPFDRVEAKHFKSKDVQQRKDVGSAIRRLKLAKQLSERKIESTNQFRNTAPVVNICLVVVSQEKKLSMN